MVAYLQTSLSDAYSKHVHNHSYLLNRAVGESLEWTVISSSRREIYFAVVHGILMCAVKIGL